MIGTRAGVDMPVSTVEFRTLGRVELAVDGRPEAVHAAKPRTLLALLLLDVNRVAERDWLLDQLWAGDPPKAALPTLRAYVYRLRQQLTRFDSGPVLRGVTGGYSLEVEVAAVDVHRFETLAAQGRRALQDGKFEDAVAATQDALDLWRGPAAFAGIDVPAVRDKARRLDDLRIEVTEQNLSAAMETGAPAGSVAELEALTAAHPLREELWRLLMLSLYRAGRQGEALEVYQRLYRLLDDELGIRPSTPVEQLHQQILTGDSKLLHRVTAQATAEATPRPEATPDRLVPRQLPASITNFTGRASQLADLNHLLPSGGVIDRPGVVAVAAITGTAGIGKTTLAIHWAHQNVDRFPDGQLYVNLRGFDPVGQPVTPAGPIRAFLDALGMPPAKIPTDLDAQAALYRSLLADKQVLVLLDNARNTEQVRPLLPGTSGSLVVVTSRDQLTGLLAQGGHPIALDQLDANEAARFVTRRLGERRTAAEPEATRQIVNACAGLPLALAVVAARAAARPDFPLNSLATELRNAVDRLDALADPDPAIDLRAVFSWSYQALATDTARLFRLLSVHPGPDFTPAAAAAIAGIDSRHAKQQLTALVRANLLIEQQPGRFSFHDLLRAYAAGLVDVADTHDERTEACHRMLDYYLHSARAASHLANAPQDPLALPPILPGVTPDLFADDKQATAWFAAERAVLPVAVDFAGEHGFDTHCWHLARSFRGHLYRRGDWPEMTAMCRTALEASLRLGDVGMQIRSRRMLADACSRLGHFEQAHTHLDEALALSEKMNDANLQSQVLQGLGHILRMQQRFAEAIECSRRALALAVATGHLSGQARALNSIGWHYALTGDFQQALTYCRPALALMRKIDDRAGQAAVLDSLGHAHLHLGQHAEALTNYLQALDLYRALHSRPGEALTHEHLGDAHIAAGNRTTARKAWQEALAILEDLGHSDVTGVRAKLAELE